MPRDAGTKMADTVRRTFRSLYDIELYLSNADIPFLFVTWI